jgi:hypothetical protein
MYVVESPQTQSPQESVSYGITTTPWGSTPTGVTVTVYDVTRAGVETDVTNTVVSGSSSTSGDIITTKRVGSLTLGNNYRMDVLFTDEDSNTWEAQVAINCRRAS